ncbi:MAG TPA: pyridoxal phosphate-dependent aminotransferase [Kofleriaceae bacterium]|nr:pyridoxal phosphate-dependent aminotransferase [Kofleriaceae bacterium]
MNARFSPRTPADLAPNRLSALTDRLRAEGRPLCDLTVSNPTAVGLPYPDAELADALAAGAIAGYAPSPRGLLSARRAVAGFLAERAAIDPDHVFLTSSSSESYGFLFKLLCAAGDQVLVPRPSYPLFEHLCRLEEVEAHSYALGPPPRFALDPDRVEVELGPRTRAVVVVSPNNPTGSVASAAALAELCSLCGERGVALIADEVFAEYPAAGAAPAPSALEAGGGLRFALGGLSKSCGLPHYKLGWIGVAGPAGLRDEAVQRLDHIADAYLSASGPVMRALPRLFQLSGDIRRAIAGRVHASRAAAARVLAGARGARLLPADGGWSAVIELGPELDEEVLALELADQHSVLIQPGYFFDFDRGAHAVVSLLAPVADVERGLAALVAAL